MPKAGNAARNSDFSLRTRSAGHRTTSRRSVRLVSRELAYVLLLAAGAGGLGFTSAGAAALLAFFARAFFFACARRRFIFIEFRRSNRPMVFQCSHSLAPQSVTKSGHPSSGPRED